MNDKLTLPIDIAEFCKRFHVYASRRDWMLANCRDMADAWDRVQPDWLIWIATQSGVLSDRVAREFACWCVRHTPLNNGRVVWDLLKDPRSRHVVEVAERFARGDATQEELHDAGDGAMAAYVASPCAAMAAPVIVASPCAASAAAMATSRTTSISAASAPAARAAQAEHLRSLGNPFRAVSSEQ